jgi:hypothetical protein
MARRWIVAIACSAVLGCKHDTKQQARKAADSVLVHQERRRVGELANAHDQFERKRLARVQTLRAVHAVIAAQPNMMNLLSHGDEHVREKLDVLQLRLDQTANLIEGLRHTNPGLWEERDDQVSNAMRGLEQARQDAWKAVAEPP